MASPDRGGTQGSRERAAVVRRWEASGLSAREFAMRHGLNAKTLQWWRWALRRGARDNPVEFVEVSAPPLAMRSGGEFAVRLPNGAEVRMGADFDPMALERLLGVLGRC